MPYGVRVLELNLRRSKFTTPFTNIYTMLIEMERYKNLVLSLELKNISKMLVFYGPTADTAMLHRNIAKNEIDVIDNKKSYLFKYFL